MLRNKEVRQFCLWMLLITAVLVLLALAVHPAAVGMVLVSAAVFSTAFFIFTAKRYQRIASLSEQIDQVLHNADVLWIHQAEEGELAILQSEIAKMTLRIQEQNRQLKTRAACPISGRYCSPAAHTADISQFDYIAVGNRIQ